MGQRGLGFWLGVRYDFEVVVLRMDAGLRVHDLCKSRGSGGWVKDMARRVAPWGGHAVLRLSTNKR